MKFLLKPKKIPPFRFDSDRGTLTTDHGTSKLRPKTAQMLDLLLKHPGQPLSKDHLITEIWSDTAVGENVLAQSIRELRLALGDDTQQPRYIRTVPKLGYEWIYEASEGEGMRLLPQPWMVAVLLFLVAGLSVWQYLKHQHEQERWRSEQIALLPIDNRTGDPKLEWLGSDPLDFLTQQLPEKGFLPQEEIQLFRHVLSRSGGSGLIPSLLKSGVGRVLEPVLTKENGAYHLRIKTFLKDGKVRLDHLEADNVERVVVIFGQYLAGGEDGLSSFLIEAWQKGLAAWKRGDFKVAVDYLEICIQEDDQFLPAHLALSRSLLRLDQTDRAAPLVQKVLDAPETQEQPALLADAHRLIGDLHRAGGALDDAQLNFQSALTIYEDLGYELGRARVLKDLALVARETGEREQAESLLLEALAIREQESEIQGQAMILSQLARTVFHTEPVRARAYFDRGRSLMLSADGSSAQLEEIYGELEQRF